jgi:predicted nucleic acid-binding protein
VYVALLDAACLVPAVLTDTLLRLAENGLYRPLWSPRILGEVRSALTRVHPELRPAAAAERLAAMDRAFPGASVDPDAWQPLVAGLELPDPDDRHVLAAAVAGGADGIVTPNLKDFPAERLAQHGLEAASPDEFLLDHLDISPARVLAALAHQAADTWRPPLTVADVLDRLSRAGAPSFAAEVLRRLPG